MNIDLTCFIFLFKSHIFAVILFQICIDLKASASASADGVMLMLSMVLPLLLLIHLLLVLHLLQCVYCRRRRNITFEATSIAGTSAVVLLMVMVNASLQASTLQQYVRVFHTSIMK